MAWPTVNRTVSINNLFSMCSLGHSYRHLKRASDYFAWPLRSMRRLLHFPYLCAWLVYPHMFRRKFGADIGVSVEMTNNP